MRNTVKSFYELVDYILTKIPGVKFFFSEKLCHDPLEGFFGNQRMHGGSTQVWQKSVSLDFLRGNCTAQNVHLVVNELEKPLLKRQRR
jgi:hypothetical protein